MKRERVMQTTGEHKIFRLRCESGFTLIEVLISLVLLTIGMMGLLASVNSVINYQKRSANETLATMHTSNKIEEIKRIATNEPTGGAYGFSYLVDDYLTAESMTKDDDYTYSKSETFDNFKRTWSLTVYPSGGSETFDTAEDISMVEVEVTTEWTNEDIWTGSSTADGQVQLASILHRRQFIE